MSGQKILDNMASRYVGDGKTQLFFVSAGGKLRAVSPDYELACVVYDAAHTPKCLEGCHGVMASSDMVDGLIDDRHSFTDTGRLKRRRTKP